MSHRDGIVWKLLNLIYYKGKYLSEPLIFASTNPQYDNRLFIVNENCKLIIPAEHIQIVVFVLTFRTIYVHTTCYPHVLSMQFSCVELVIQ